MYDQPEINTGSKQQSQSKAPPPPSEHGRNWTLLAVSLAGAALVVMLFILFRQRETVVVHSMPAPAPGVAVDVNLGQVTDATTDRNAVARDGYRYKVFITEETDDGSSGVARVGGLVTFVPGARKGQIAIITVARVKERVADAVLEQVVGTMSAAELAAVPAASAPRSRPARAPGASLPPELVGVAPVEKNAAAATANDVVPNSVFKGLRVDSPSRKNPDLEAIAHIEGLVVVVAGAKEGQTVTARITDRTDRMAFAEVVSVEAGAAAEPVLDVVATPVEKNVAEAKASEIIPGSIIHGVKIDDASRKNPETEKVAHIDGLVIFVSGGQVGEVVSLKITERRARAASAVIVPAAPVAP